MGTLGRILSATQDRVATLCARRLALEAAAERAAPPGALSAVLRGSDVALVAEVKRRSPSRGAINDGLSIVPQARAYTSGGAAAISILTEPEHFGGAASDLEQAARAVGVPLLKKDFHVDPIQAVEARALGASALLLIVRALPPAALGRMMAAAREWGLEAVVEVHSEQELEQALAVDATLIGVNNRDLETLAIDRSTAERLIPLIPRDRVAIAESGIGGAADVQRAALAGADAVLVGSFVSAAADPLAAVRALTGVRRASATRRG